MKHRLIGVALLTLACGSELPTSPVGMSSEAAPSSNASVKRRAATVGAAIQPPCSSPVPYLTAVCPAGGYLVRLRDGVDARQVVEELQAKYAFRASSVWESVAPGFAAPVLSVQAIAGLRCERTVATVEENAEWLVGGAVSRCR